MPLGNLMESTGVPMFASQPQPAEHESADVTAKGKEDPSTVSAADDQGTATNKHAVPEDSAPQARKLVLMFLKQINEKLKGLLPILLKEIEPVEASASRILLKRLSSMSNDGQAPSFSEAGARSGYIRRRLQHRAAQVAIALMHPLLASVNEALKDSKAGTFEVASIGGGPGSDAVGLTLLRNHLSSKRELRTVVYDLEDGWHTTVDKLQDSMEAAGISCEAATTLYQHCNVVLPLADDQNRDLRAKVARYDLVVFSFVLAENRIGLTESNFEFVRGLMVNLKPSAGVLILDCTFQIFQPITGLYFAIFVAPLLPCNINAMDIRAQPRVPRVVLEQPLNHAWDVDLAEELGWCAHRIHWKKDINGHCKSVLYLEKRII